MLVHINIVIILFKNTFNLAKREKGEKSANRRHAINLSKLELLLF